MSDVRTRWLAGRHFRRLCGADGDVSVMPVVDIPPGGIPTIFLLRLKKEPPTDGVCRGPSIRATRLALQLQGQNRFLQTVDHRPQINDIGSIDIPSASIMSSNSACAALSLASTSPSVSPVFQHFDIMVRPPNAACRKRDRVFRHLVCWYNSSALGCQLFCASRPDRDRGIFQ